MPPPSAERIKQILAGAKAGESLRKVLNPHLGKYMRFKEMTRPTV